MKSFKLILCLSIVLPSSILSGQESNVPELYGIFQSRDEYHQFMGSVKSAAANDPEMASMIGLINDIVLSQPIGSTDKQYGGTTTNLALLADPEVRGDIGMIDEQYKDLQVLNTDIQKRVAEQLRGLDFTDSDNIVAQIHALRGQAEKDLDAVLLPHQLERLRQIRTQSQLRYRSLVELLTSDPLKTDLKITENQSDELKEYEKEIQEDLLHEIAKLQEKARKKLLTKLNRSQQEQVEILFGPAFDFRPSAKSANAEKTKNGSR